jgi:hypothetical protein
VTIDLDQVPRYSQTPAAESVVVVRDEDEAEDRVAACW